MNRVARMSVAVLLLAVGGCSGGGEADDATVIVPPPSPPPPPPPPPTGDSVGGIWTGELLWEHNGLPGTGGRLNVRALVDETGEFRWSLDDQSLLWGKFQVSDTDVSDSDIDGAGWALASGIANPVADVWGDVFVRGTITERVSLTGGFLSYWTTAEERVGTFALAYDELYDRNSSLAILAGTYTTASDSLVINDQGALFYQSSANHCVGNGSVALIDPEFNMYRVTMRMDNCTGDGQIRNQATFTGLAFLSDSGGGAMNDVVEAALVGGTAIGCPWICYGIWDLVARK